MKKLFIGLFCGALGMLGGRSAMLPASATCNQSTSINEYAFDGTGCPAEIRSGDRTYTDLEYFRRMP